MADEPSSDVPDERPAGDASAIPGPVYEELRHLAAAYLGGARSRHTLQPTALVHEAYLKLARSGDRWNDRTHFRAVAARAMRQILVDYARQKKTDKRGGDWGRITLDDAVEATSESAVDLEILEAAMNDLAGLDERKSQVVELRFYGGLTFEEIARTLSVSQRTAEGDWYMARAWLRRRLSSGDT